MWLRETSGKTKRIQLECQSFLKVGTIIADGGTRDRGTNIVTVPPLSGQLATMSALYPELTNYNRPPVSQVSTSNNRYDSSTH